MRFVGERRACAAAVLSFFMLLFLLNGLMGPPALMPMFVSLGAAYLVAFFGVVACWFWARWFALGLAFSGLVMSGMLAWQIGFDPVVIIFGGTHLVVGLALLGQQVAASYDGRADWRARWKLDDNGVNRLGKAIMRAGASLPYLIMAGLAPKQGMGTELLGIAAVLAGAIGIAGIVRMRTWGVFALAGAGIAAVGLERIPSPELSQVVAPAIAGLLLLAAVVPFVPAIVSRLTSSRSAN